MKALILLLFAILHKIFSFFGVYYAVFIAPISFIGVAVLKVLFTWVMNGGNEAATNTSLESVVPPVEIMTVANSNVNGVANWCLFWSLIITAIPMLLITSRNIIRIAKHDRYWSWFKQIRGKNMNQQHRT